MSLKVAPRLCLLLASLCVNAGLAPLARTAARLRSASAPASSVRAAAAQPPSSSSAAETHFVRQVQMVTKDLVVSRATQTAYASVPSSAGAGGNSIAPLGLATGAVGTPVFIGSEPGDLGISDDGQVIWALLDSARAVRRFDVATQTAGLQFSPERDQFGQVPAPRQVKVAPGSHGTIALQGGGSDFDSRLYVFDDGVQRGAGLPSSADRLEFSASPTRLYTSSSATTVMGELAGLSRVNLTPTGPAYDGDSTTVPVRTGEIKFDAGRLYAASGHVYDPETGAVLGAFSANDLSSRATVAPDSAVGRVYFAAPCTVPLGCTSITLRAFDMNTFAEVGSFTVPGATGEPSSLARWGDNGLVFRTGTHVYIIQTTLVPSNTPVPTPTPTPVTTPTPLPTPNPTPQPGELRSVTLPANDLVINPNTQTIYASVPSSAGAGGNSITPVDPAAGAAGAPVFVGSEPTRMAISDDGQVIYVGLDGARAVRRFDVATQTAGLQFSLFNASEPSVAGDMAVVPGQTDAVAVARRTTGGNDGGVAIYDNGAARPRTASRMSGIEYSASPSVLYGFNGFDSGSDFRRLGAASCGVSVLSNTPHLGVGQDFKVANGRAYSPGGLVIDPEAGQPVGTFALGVFRGPMLPDPAAGRIYFLAPHDTAPATLTLRVYDIDQFVLLGALDLPDFTVGTVGPEAPGSLLRWGANGLAFRALGKIFLLQNGLIGGSDPGYTPAPPPPTSAITLGGRVADFRDGAVGVGDVTVGVTGSLVTSVVTDAGGNFQIPGVGVCDQLTVTPAKPTYTFTPPSRTVADATASGPLLFEAFPRLVRFVQSNDFLMEGESHRRFYPVHRTGDLSVAATVDYATEAGTASDRSDYTAAYGTLRFAPGEASKSIVLLFTDDAHVEGSENLQLRLLNSTGVPVDESRASVFIGINDNDTEPATVSPLQSASFFVRRHYQDFLGRDPADDPAGFVFWTNQLAACDGVAEAQARADCLEERRVNVSAAFFLSIEFQQTGYFVQRLYATSFPDGPARPRGLPRFAEFMSDVREVREGVIVNVGDWEQRLEQNRQSFARRWVERAEFLTQFPAGLSAGQFVDTLFANAGAAPTDAERAAALAAYGGGGTEGRAAALRSVADSGSVYNRQYNPAFVLMQYFGYLRRNPFDPPEATLDYAGYDFWLAKLNQFTQPGEDARDERVAILRVRRAEMVKSFLVSGEYMGRFGPENFDIRK